MQLAKKDQEWSENGHYQSQILGIRLQLIEVCKDCQSEKSLIKLKQREVKLPAVLQGYIISMKKNEFFRYMHDCFLLFLHSAIQHFGAVFVHSFHGKSPMPGTRCFNNVVTVVDFSIITQFKTFVKSFFLVCNINLTQTRVQSADENCTECAYFSFSA